LHPEVGLEDFGSGEKSQNCRISLGKFAAMLFILCKQADAGSRYAGSRHSPCDERAPARQILYKPSSISHKLSPFLLILREGHISRVTTWLFQIRYTRLCRLEVTTEPCYLQQTFTVVNTPQAAYDVT